MTQPNPLVRGIALQIHTAAGVLIEQHTFYAPFVFQPGTGDLLAAIESRMAGAHDFEKRNFVIPFVEAFGIHDPSAVTLIPRTAFDKSTRLVPNTRISGRRANGSSQRMTILEVLDETVRVDMNHPLAGKDLHVQASFVPIRNPTPTATFHKIPRGTYLH